MNSNDLLLNGGPDGQVLTSRNGMPGWEAAAGGGTGNGGMFRVRLATTANGTLASAFDNGSILDGETIATGDYLLLKNQTDATENGVYTAVASGAPTRVADFETADTVHGYVISVVEGTVNADSVWLCTNNTGSDVVDTDDLVFARLGAGGPGLLRVSVHTASGTWTKGSGTTRVIVEVQGPGGGGGGVDGQGAGTAGSGGGGGSGGYAKKLISDVSAISSSTITVGTGGAGGTAGANNGSNGSAASSYADGTTTVTGNLGSGGAGVTASANYLSGAGGAGGTGASGDVNITGQSGFYGIAANTEISQIGTGGDSVLGFGGGSVPGTSGTNATVYGAGGGGAAQVDSVSNLAGGNGSAGIVIVWEYGFETSNFDATIGTLTTVTLAPDDVIAIGDTSNGGSNANVLATDFTTQLPVVGARVYMSGDDTHDSTGNWLTLEFDSENFDTASFHDPSSNPSRITLPLAGKYLVISGTSLGVSGTGALGHRVIVNGVTTDRVYVNSQNNNASQNLSMTASAVRSFAANDYLEMQTLQTSGGNLTIFAVNTFFLVIFLGT